MGVSGMKGVLDQEKSLHNTLILANTKVIVDLNDPPHWFFTKSSVGEQRSDKLGTDLIECCAILRLLILRLKHFNITPVFVYSGARLNANYHSDFATQARHLEKSTRVSNFVLNKYGQKNFNLTPLVTNALKQVIKEFPDLPSPIQAQYETYPILQKLAEEFACPVMTSHSDFILKPLRTGFILLEELFPLTSPPQRGIPISNYYSNSLLLARYGLQRHSGALPTLYALLRPDMSGRYCKYINELLRLQNTDLEIPRDDTEFVYGRRPNYNRNLTRRLRSILENWPKNLTTADLVRNELVRISRNDGVFLKDYDDVLRTFEERLDFARSVVTDDRFVRASALSNRQIEKVNDALIVRCATSNFLVNLLMGQKLYENNQTYEDFSTQRSSFSVADPVRSFIMGRFGVASLQILDRQFSEVFTRTLYAYPVAPNEPVYSQHIYKIFLFPESIQSNENLTDRIRDFRVKLALKDNYAEELVVLLRLVSYIFKLVFKDNLERDEKKSGAKKDAESPKKNPKMGVNYGRDGLIILATAVYNCFMFYIMKDNMKDKLNMQNLENDRRLCDDSKFINYLPDLRIARTEIEKLIPLTCGYNIVVKHIVEMLNRAIQGYCEVNSLYENKTYPLKISEYYNGAVIHKIVCKLMETKAEGLIRLERPLEDFILE